MSDPVTPDMTVRQQVLALVKENPGLTVTQLLARVTGKSEWRPQVNAACLELMTLGELRCEKGSDGVFHYYPHASE